MTYQKELATDGLLLKRWRTLLSVDDIVEQLVNRVTALGQMKSTYFFFFADNGTLKILRVTASSVDGCYERTLFHNMPGNPR